MKRFWNWIRNEAGGRVLRLEGPIDEESFWGDEVTPKAFREELEALGFAEIADAEEPVRYPDGKEGPVSENALLTDGERSVSLSCQDGAGSLLISREKTE